MKAWRHDRRSTPQRFGGRAYLHRDQVAEFIENSHSDLTIDNISVQFNKDAFLLEPVLRSHDTRFRLDPQNRTITLYPNKPLSETDWKPHKEELRQFADDMLPTESELANIRAAVAAAEARWTTRFDVIDPNTNE